MRTITLEFLRHGPPNNQLLSPLTRYLVLCGNLPAVTVEVPFEHAEFLGRLHSFRYKGDNKVRNMLIDEIAKKLALLLEQIPGLISELGDSAGLNTPVTHLRLILTANELALLPFELSNAPAGVPGAGQPMALQADGPICLTREIRRVKDDNFQWPSKPKILFAFASPEGVAPVPYEAHLLALRQIVDPWVYYYADDEEMHEQVGRHLRVLPNASIDSIAQECASGEFTHVHILAHGIDFKKGEDLRYGLALHDHRNPALQAMVDGDSLATAIRSRVSDSLKTLVQPAVVTIASCDGGNVGGTVYGAGASIAHALHREGIPLVVASQFPLSLAGSVYMVKILYEGLLKGNDPRLCLDDLRRQLKIRVPKTHDWASIAAYSAFPDNFEKQLSRFRIDRAALKIRAALNIADQLGKSMSEFYDTKKKSKIKKERKWETLRIEVIQAFERLEQGIKQLNGLLEDAEEDAAKIHGLLASSTKREAEIHSRALDWFPDVQDEEKSRFQSKIKDSLRKAKEHYTRVFELDRTHTWALVQEISLEYVMGSCIDCDAWRTARMLSSKYVERSDFLDAESMAWAHSDLLELCVLALIDSDLMIDESIDSLKEKATHQAQALIRLSRQGVNLHSVTRQLLRYFEVYSAIRTTVFCKEPIPSDPQLFAKEMVNLLYNY